MLEAVVGRDIRGLLSSLWDCCQLEKVSETSVGSQAPLPPIEAWLFHISAADEAAADPACTMATRIGISFWLTAQWKPSEWQSQIFATKEILPPNCRFLFQTATATP